METRELPPPSTRLRDRVMGLLVLVGIPAGLAFGNGAWLWDGPGRDPWLYYGFFRFASIYQHDFNTLYYSSRLSVILPGHLIRSVLSVVPANLVLHLLLYGIAVAALWGTVALLYGEGAALIAATALAVYPWFLRSIGRNMVDGFGLTYALLGLLFLTLALRDRRWRLWQLLAGAAVAALVSANLFYGLSAAFLAFYFVGLSYRDRDRALWRDALWFSVGCVATLAGMAVTSKICCGGRLNFIVPTLEFLKVFLSQPSIYKLPASLWLRSGGWLVFPTLVFVGAVGTAAREREWSRRFVQIHFLLFAIAMWVWQMTSHGVTLQFPYYASMMIPFAFVAFGGQLASLLEARISSRLWLVAACLGVVGIAAAVLAKQTHPSLGLWHGPIPLVLGLAQALIPAFGYRGSGALGLVLASLGLSFFVTAQGGSLKATYPHDDGKAFFVEVDQSTSALAAFDPQLHLRLWFDQREAGYPLFDTLASTTMLCPRLVGELFPDLNYGVMCDRARMGPGLKLVVLSARPDAFETATAALRTIGLGARSLGIREFAEPVPYRMIFLETEAVH
jgi:hypothetical protein